MIILIDPLAPPLDMSHGHIERERERAALRLGGGGVLGNEH